MKIEFKPNISNIRSISFSAKTVQNVVSEQKDSFDKEDVSHNFTYKNVSESFLKAKQVLTGKSVIEGVSYGKNYNLVIDRKTNLTTITGKIGNETVNITSKRRKKWGNKFDIDGQVGDKKVSLVEKNGFLWYKKYSGNFGEEPINIMSQHFRHNEMITGDGIDMKLMYYVSQYSSPKYVGKYELSLEFLPVFAALTRYW